MTCVPLDSPSHHFHRYNPSFCHISSPYQGTLLCGGKSILVLFFVNSNIFVLDNLQWQIMSNFDQKRYYSNVLTSVASKRRLIASCQRKLSCIWFPVWRQRYHSFYTIFDHLRSTHDYRSQTSRFAFQAEMFVVKLWKLPRNPAFPCSVLPIGSDRCCTWEFMLAWQSWS